MNSIKEVIKSSKLIHSLPNNQLTVMTPPLTQPHGQSPSQTLPHSSTATALHKVCIYIIVQLVYILFQSIHTSRRLSFFAPSFRINKINSYTTLDILMMYSIHILL